MKKFYAFFILIFTTILFCGCVNIEYYRLSDSSGVILDKVVIEVDTEKLSQNHFNWSSIRAMIDSDVQRYKDIVALWKQDYSNTIPNDDFINYIDSGVTVETVTVGNKITISTTFMDMQLFILFYNDSVITIDEVVYEMDKCLDDYGLFLNEDYSDRQDLNVFIYKDGILKSNNLFNDIETNKFGLDVTHSFYDKYMDIFSGTFDLDDVSIMEVYGTTNSKVRSNATDTEQVADVTFHYWELTNLDKDNSLEIYRLLPNRTIWYILALTISIILVIILILIAKGKDIYIFIQSKKKKVQFYDLENKIAESQENEELNDE